MTTAGIYTRISKDDGTALGVGRQRADCEDLCQRRGLNIHAVYEDNDLSAFTGGPRPSYRRLLDDVEAGQIGVIVAWHPDRLHRSPRELEDFMAVLEKAGAQVATVTAGDRDFATPEGRVMARIEGAIARKESEDKSRRLRRKHLELAMDGKPAGGPRHYGYTPAQQVVPHEAALIRELAERVLAGDTVRSVAHEWNRRGVPSPAGVSWSVTTAKRILVAATVAGFRDHPEAGLVRAQWEPIIDETSFRRLRALLLDPARRTNEGARRYLLTGRVFCGLCGVRLHARPRSGGERCYVCASGPGFGGCGKIRRTAANVEDLVVEMALARTPAALPPPAEGPGLRLVQEDTEALEALARDHYVDRLISREEFLSARSALEARVVESKRAMAKEAQRAALPSLPLAEVWDSLPFDRRRACLAAVVDRVILHPAVRGLNRFDPSKVEVVWA